MFTQIFLHNAEIKSAKISIDEIQSIWKEVASQMNILERNECER